MRRKKKIPEYSVEHSQTHFAAFFLHVDFLINMLFVNIIL